MKITQAYEITNSLVKQFLGEEEIVRTDLSNIIDVGKKLLDATDYETIYGTLSDMFARTYFDNKAYKGSLQSLVKDGVQYGTIIRKVRSNLIQAVKSQPWDLEDGTDYSENVYHKGSANQTLYNSKDVWGFEYSLPQYQLESSFSSATDLMSFYSMMQQKVQNSIELHLENLAKATLSGAIAEVALHEVSDGNYANHSGVQFINVLKLYNDSHGTQLTKEQILQNSDLMSSTNELIFNTIDAMKEYSVLLNRQNYETFTRDPKLVLLKKYVRACEFKLYNDTFHDSYVKVPEHEGIYKWQGSGTQATRFEDLSKISVVAPESKKEFTLDGIIGVLFDPSACGVYSIEKRANAKYVKSADFTNFFHFIETSCFIDSYENMVVFYVA